MTTQADKGISTIAYNFLNLPVQVVQNGVTTEYLYRADGTKLKKSYGTGKVTDYLDGFQYELENGETKLQFIPTAEGYYDFVKNLYIYNYVDHLGNVRLSYADNNKNGTIEASTEIIEENDYYPFGLKHNNIRGANPSYQYKYNGKELQESGMYDYGARFYMPDIGRWTTQDDLSELQFYYSPYSYVYNNPIFFNDPTGMIGEESVGGEPKKKEKEKIREKTIPEVVITVYRAVKPKVSEIDVDKTLRLIAPIAPNTPEQNAMINARYGKCGHNDIGCDFKKMWAQIKDIPGDFMNGVQSIVEGDDAEEMVIATAFLILNAKKGKLGNVAVMGNLGGKFSKLARLLKLNIKSPTTLSILENADKTVQEFISTHRKGNLKSVFPAEYLNSTVKEALQSGNTTVRKLLTDSRFLK